MSQSEQLFERACQHIPGGVNSPVRAFKGVGGTPVFFSRGEGPWLFDADGKRYVDYVGSWGPMIGGHCHPEVVKAVQQAAASGLGFGAPTEIETRMADTLCQLVPSLEQVRMVSLGTEATMSAIRLARGFTGRDNIVKFEGCYHGHSDSLLVKAGSGALTLGVPTSPGVPADLAKYTLTLEYNNAEQVRNLFAEMGDQIAAIIVEPIQGKGVNVPDKNYLPEVERLCEKYGALFVADEVQTGLGRTGKFWAIEHWGVQPDMICMAKALSGGFVPIGAVAMTQKVMDAVFNRMDRAVVHGSTFSKNNLAMAAGLATLQVIEDEKLVENSAKVGKDIINAINATAGKYEFLKEARGMGMMIAIEFHSPQSLSLKAAWSMLEAANKGLFCQMITIPLFKDHHILTQVAGHGMNVVKLLPPLNLTQKDHDWIVNAFDQAIADTHKVPGSIWSLGKTLASHAIKNKK